MTTYRHTQVGTLVLIALGFGVALTVGVLFLVSTAPDRALVGAVLGVLLVCIFLFRKLNVTLDSNELEVSFGPGAFRKHFQVVEIISARMVRNPWYYGWGIRLTPHGWMYNVSGFDAVQIELIGNRKFLIGTDDPEQLLNAIGQVSGCVT